MNSIAIWGNKNIELELHVNVWHTLKRITWYKKIYNKFANVICPLPKINEFSNYIEFGIKILKNENENNFIYIYLPIKNLSNDDIKDKTLLLSDDIKLTKALFNSKAEFISDESVESVKVKIKDDKTIIYQKFSSYDLELKELGTIIKFKIDKQESDNEFYYYRFRINKIYDLIKEIDTNSSWLDGFLDKKAILELSINQKRKIPYEIDFKDNIKFKQLNSFLLTDDDVEINSLHDQNFSARILEKHIWNDYIDTNIKLSNIIAYQWDFQDDNGFSSLSLLIKLSYRIKKILYFWQTILFIIVIGGISGIIGNFGTDLVKNKIICKKENNETNSVKTK